MTSRSLLQRASTPSEGASTPREQLVLAAILLIGLVLRLIHIHELRGDILFEHPILDEDVYVSSARALAHGGAGQSGAYWQPPGIVYALALIFRLAGDGLYLPRVVQALMSTACAFLLSALASRFVSRGVALAAAAVISLHGVFIFASSELLPAVFIAFFDLLTLLLLARALERRSWRLAAAAGVALGVSAVFSPVALTFTPVAAALLWTAGGGRRGALLATVFSFSLLAPILPVTYRNWQVAHDPVLISSNGGLNFFIGNNADYQTTLATRPGRHWKELADEEPDQQGIAGPDKPRYFYRKALSFIETHPFRAFSLFARKIYLFFDGAEIPRDADIYASRSRSLVLSALLWPAPLCFPTGLLIPLSLIGVAATWRQRRRLALLLAFVAVQALTISAFFVTSRYRLPSLPVFAIFACLGAVALVDALRSGRLARRAAILTGTLLLLVLCNLPTWETKTSYRGELDFYRGWASKTFLNDQNQAVYYYHKAAEETPDDPRIWFELGLSLDQLQQPAAIDAWRRAVAADPWDLRPRRRLAGALARTGDLDGAIGVLQATIAAKLRNPEVYVAEHFNMAQLYAAKNDYGHAIAEFGAAARIDPRYCRTQAPGVARGMAEKGSAAAAAFWRELAEVFQRCGSDEAAEVALRRASELTR